MSLHTISPQTLKQWLDNKEVLLIDVREPAEHKAESIPSAALIPLAKISKSVLPTYSNKKLVIHCRKGARGGTACEKLLGEDPTLDVYNLEGGMDAWKNAGFIIKSSGHCFLPLDQQVQLTVGVVVLTASILAYLINPLFFLISGICGAGLTVAGLTGFCGLAHIMARMPWNQSSIVSSCCSEKNP